MYEEICLRIRGVRIYFLREVLGVLGFFVFRFLVFLEIESLWKEFFGGVFRLGVEEDKCRKRVGSSSGL